MKKLGLLTLAAFFAVAITAVNANSTDPLNDGKKQLKASTTASQIEWKAAKVTGKHNGAIKLKEGILETEDGKLTGGTFVVDMTTIEVLDLSGGSKAKLEGHLKSDDFFGVESHPEAKLMITEVTEKGKNTYDVTGDLMIKGITNPISFEATTAEEDGLMVAEAEIVIDRSKYNVRYGSPTFFNNIGDKAIYDEFTLNVKVVAD